MQIQTTLGGEPDLQAQAILGAADGARPAHGRWAQLACSVGLAPQTNVVLALSGGADSVYLLHVLAAARESPLLAAVHIDHGLRGAESIRDMEFCRDLCARLGVRFVSRAVALDPSPSGLEARAREERYAVLAQEARRLRVRTIVTGHHADDALETLLMRWMRGTDLGGLASLARERSLARDASLRVVRPLLFQRREEVRQWLQSWNEPWCEDSSNSDTRFARNRVRHVVLPHLTEQFGSGALANLKAFARAVESLESNWARATEPIAWSPPATSLCARSVSNAHLGGRLPRAAVARLPKALRRRSLWRLVLEGVGCAPRRALLDQIDADLAHGRCARHALPRGWDLHLRSKELVLVPPKEVLASAGPGAWRSRREVQLSFEFERSATVASAAEDLGISLSVPGRVNLGPGRTLLATKVPAEPGRPIERNPACVELDWRACSAPLRVRQPLPGDRVRLLGASGSRPLARALADMGIPRAERGQILLVLSGEQIVWIVGLRPSEHARIRPTTLARLRLELSREPDASVNPVEQSNWI